MRVRFPSASLFSPLRPVAHPTRPTPTTPGSKLGTAYRLILSDDWDAMRIFLAQSNLANDIMLECALAGSRAGVSSEEFIDYMGSLLRRARDNKRYVPLKGAGDAIRLGDGSFSDASADADELPEEAAREVFVARQRPPEKGTVNKLKLVIDRIIGGEPEPGLKLSVNGVHIEHLRNGRNIRIDLPAPAEDEQYLTIQFHAHINDNGDVDDLQIEGAVIEYYHREQ